MIQKSLLLGSVTSLLLILQAAAAELIVKPSVDAVTVFPSGAMITELADVSLPLGTTTLVIENFPEFINIDTLRAAGQFSGVVTVQSINHRETTRDISTPEIDALQMMLDAVEEERGGLEDALSSAQAQLVLVEEFARQAPRGFTEALAKGADALSEWQTALDAIQSGQTASRGTIRSLTRNIEDLRERQSDLEEQILRLQQSLSRRSVLVDVNAQNASTGTLEIRYQTSQASWSAGYDAFLSTDLNEKVKLDLVQLASVAQLTERKWEDVQLTLSTTQPARGTSAPLLETLQVFEQRLERERYSQTQKLDAQSELDDRLLSAPAPVPAGSRRGIAGNVLVQSRVIAEPVKQQTAAADLGSFKANFVIPGRVNISGDGAAKRLTLARHSVSPELLAVSVPNAQEAAFLHAQIKNETGSPLLGGSLSAYRDGPYVGRTHFDALAIGEERSLGFGPDNKIAISYVTEDRQFAEQGIISSEKTDTRRYVTKVTNNHDQAIRIRVVDRQPFSENETIRVERLSSSTSPSEENVNDQRGILAWSFVYEPGESRDINFDYRLTWPAEKNVSFGSPEF
ncbi:MAG: mucoidy inhibitor MuiA family protein [Hyphomicrobiales bacterium]